MRAHPASLIIVYVGVGQHCRAQDVESPALPTTSTRTFQRGNGTLHVGSIMHKTHALPRHITDNGCNVFVHLAPIEVGNATRTDEKSSALQKESKHVKRSSGALDDSSRKLQKASTHSQLH